VIHEHDNEEETEPRILAVVKELSIAIIFVAGALVIAWLVRLFPGGKAPTLVYAFVILSDLILILGATLEFARALRTLLRPWGLFAGRGRRAVAPAPDSSGGLGWGGRLHEQVRFDRAGVIACPPAREPHLRVGRGAEPERGAAEAAALNGLRGVVARQRSQVGGEEPLQLEDRIFRPAPSRVEVRPWDAHGVERPLSAARAQPEIQPPVRENVGRGHHPGQQRWVSERGVAPHDAPQPLHGVEPGLQQWEGGGAAKTVGGEVSPNLGFWSVTLRGPNCRRYPPRVVQASIDNPESFRSHLVGIARIEEPSETDAGEQWIEKYELEVRKLGTGENSPALAILRWDESSLAAAPMSLREPAEHEHLAKVVGLRSGRRTARAARE
jgi:hypothetical protein